MLAPPLARLGGLHGLGARAARPVHFRGRAMFIIFDDNRLSDSPFIERVWRCHSEREGVFVSVATSHWDFVVTRLKGKLTVTLKGPETKASDMFCPADG